MLHSDRQLSSVIGPRFLLAQERKCCMVGFPGIAMTKWHYRANMEICSRFFPAFESCTKSYINSLFCGFLIQTLKSNTNPVKIFEEVISCSVFHLKACWLHFCFSLGLPCFGCWVTCSSKSGCSVYNKKRSLSLTFWFHFPTRSSDVYEVLI